MGYLPTEFNHLVLCEAGLFRPDHRLVTDPRVGPPDPDQVARALAWIDEWADFRKTFNDASQQKVPAEQWPGGYVANGSWIQAAILCGFKLDPIDPHRNGWARFNMSVAVYRAHCRKHHGHACCNNSKHRNPNFGTESDLRRRIRLLGYTTPPAPELVNAWAALRAAQQPIQAYLELLPPPVGVRFYADPSETTDGAKRAEQ